MDTTQSQTTDGLPGLEPQPPVTAPDPSMFKLPQQPAGQSQTRDWEASFNGLMRRYNDDRLKWDNEKGALTTQLTDLTNRLAALEKQAPAGQKPPAEPQGASPAPSAPEQPGDPMVQELYDRVVQLEAERHRDGLLLQYTQAGQPGYGLPLLMFKDNIPIIAPDVDENGKVNDAAQREAIEKFIGALKELRTGGQQAVAAGYTPGSAPGPTRPSSQDELTDEYYKLKEQMGKPEFDRLSQAEQDKIRNRYYDLQSEVGWTLPGQTMPFLDGQTLWNEFQKMLNKMAIPARGT